MLAMAVLVSAVGVKAAVRVKPLPLIVESSPPVTVTSPTVPFLVKNEPGSSPKLDVIVEAPPAFSAEMPGAAYEHRLLGIVLNKRDLCQARVQGRVSNCFVSRDYPQRTSG
jgi:hypothetical protein